MEMLNRMAAEAVRELDAIRHPSAGARAKNLAKSLLGRGSATISDPIFWPAGLLLTGLMETGHAGNAAGTSPEINTAGNSANAFPGNHASGDATYASSGSHAADDASDLRKYSSSVEEYLAGWLRQGAPVRNPDDALTGSVVLELYAQTGNPAYKEAADKIAAYLKGCLRDANGSIIYGQQSGNSRIYADGAGMTAMFLARYAKIARSEHHAEPDAAPGQSEDVSAISDHLPDETERNTGCTNDMGTAGATGNLRKEAGSDANTSDKNTADAANGQRDESTHYDPMDDARRQLLNYARYGMDVRSGLPYHAYDAENGLKLGIIGWGRAVGWLLLGLSEYLICNPDDEELADFTQTILNAVSDRVRPDGMLSWQLDCIEGPLDTSATGMIFYAMLRMNRTLHAPQKPNKTSETVDPFPDSMISAAFSLDSAASASSFPDIAEPASSPAKAPHACPKQSGMSWIDSSLLDAAAAALRECVAEDGKVYWCSAECIDIAQYSQQFGHYSWGQAAVLAFLALYESCPT